MKTEDNIRMKLLRSGVFATTDIVEIEVSFSKLAEKKFKNTEHIDELIETQFLEDFEKVIKTGDMWKFNPTCIELFVEKNKFQYDREKLLEHIIDLSDFSVDEIDINKNYYKITCEFDILLINLIAVDPELVEKSNKITVRTVAGSIEL